MFYATASAAPSRLIFQLLRYSRYRDICMDVLKHEAVFVQHIQLKNTIDERFSWDSVESPVETKSDDDDDDDDDDNDDDDDDDDDGDDDDDDDDDGDDDDDDDDDDNDDDDDDDDDNDDDDDDDDDGDDDDDDDDDGDDDDDDDDDGDDDDDDDDDGDDDDDDDDDGDDDDDDDDDGDDDDDDDDDGAPQIYRAIYIYICRVRGEMAQWLERECTDRKVRGSNPTSASRLPLFRLGQPASIPALVLPSGCMAARHQKSVAAERASR
ncbi:hypothetical protein CSKR_110147 [Clonorchis sinensis]|uniref:Uncharacterized protein n=1 Tax=Clonorchis sinensis TaxID=79923 RepID=A0A3R7FWS8_CLOSI|nr:hypothetical protein CSKR_110147 [Clonorchis sinensis]